MQTVSTINNGANIVPIHSNGVCKKAEYGMIQTFYAHDRAQKIQKQRVFV